MQFYGHGREYGASRSQGVQAQWGAFQGGVGRTGLREMFKAQVADNVHEFVTTLDEEWVGREEDLREMARAGKVVCPQCVKELWFRFRERKVGKTKRPHFAHRAASDCPADRRSPAELECAALLYRWLRSKYPEGVEAEVDLRIPGWDRPADVVSRHVDQATMHSRSRESIVGITERTELRGYTHSEVLSGRRILTTATSIAIGALGDAAMKGRSRLPELSRGVATMRLSIMCRHKFGGKCQYPHANYPHILRACRRHDK